MIKYFISHQWKKSARKNQLSEGIGVKIVYWFMTILILFYVVLAGIFIDVILEKSVPGQEPLFTFLGGILFYFALDIIMRLQLQETPVLDIAPYLHLPIRKGKMLHFMLSKSLTSLFNYLPFFIFIPFAIKVIGSDYGVSGVLSWLFTMIGLVLFNNFIAIYIKRHFVGNFKVVLGFFLLVLAGIAVNYFGLIDFSGISRAVFMYSIKSPIIIVPIILMVTVAYYLNYVFLRKNAYIEELSNSKNKGDYKAVNASFLHKYGTLGQLILLELKLIFRNKRAKMMFWMSVVFLAYGLIFYGEESYEKGFGMYTFLGTFITGLFMMNYGQLLLSWNSQFFDKIISLKIDIKTYYDSKFWLFFVTSTGAFILSLPYVYFGWKVLIINFAAYLFNVGFNGFVIMYLNMDRAKRITLTSSSVFNYEGITATQFIMMIPVMVIPVLTVVLFSFFNLGYVGVAFLGLLGVVGLIMKPWCLSMLEKRFLKKKYEISAGLRKE